LIFGISSPHPSLLGHPSRPSNVYYLDRPFIMCRVVQTDKTVKQVAQPAPRYQDSEAQRISSHKTPRWRSNWRKLQNAHQVCQYIHLQNPSSTFISSTEPGGHDLIVVPEYIEFWPRTVIYAKYEVSSEICTQLNDILQA